MNFRAFGVAKYRHLAEMTIHYNLKIVYAKGNIKKKTEDEGFEPPVPCGTAVFKTAAFNHSANPPDKSDELGTFQVHKGTI